MKPAILFYSDTTQNAKIEYFIEGLSKEVTLIIVSSFNEVKRLIRKEDYSVYILLTNLDSFPSHWQMSELKAERTIMILNGLSQLNTMLLNSFLESLRTCVKRSSENPHFLQSLHYLDENYCDNELSLEKVASKAYVSKCYYSRIFQKYVGKGFKEYVIDKRIQKAKLLLQKGNSVTDVCFSIGYSDLTHFARIFKRIVGVNPSIYKSEYMNSESRLHG